MLYHGTAEYFLKSIVKKCLLKDKRHHVHLSKNIEIASKVGKRHSQLVILKIDAKQMYQDSYPFYISLNQIY